MTLNSPLFEFEEGKGMGNFSMMIPKFNYIWLWNWLKRGKHTHIYTLPRLHAQPWHSPASVVASSKGLDQWGRKAQTPVTDKRELTGFKPFPKHSSHKGPYKYLWVQKQRVLLIPLVIPFHNKEETHVTSIKVQHTNSSNGCLYVAINNM